MNGEAAVEQDAAGAEFDDRLAPASLLLSALAAAALAGCGGGDATDPGGLQAVDAGDGIGAALAGRPKARRLAVDTARRVVRLPDATALLDWAERQYGDIFPGPQRDIEFSPYIYRYYPATGNYVGVAGQDVYILGPVSGGGLLKVGTLADFAGHVFPAQFPATDVDAVRFLHQAQFGATDQDLAAVRARGYGGWLYDQFTMTPGLSGVGWLDAGGYNQVDLATRFYFDQGLGDRMAWAQLFSRKDTLRTRVALALSEYFVVSITGIDSIDSWVVNYGAAAYWDLLCSHAFGNFRALLEAVTLSPAMGGYLGTLKNLKEDPTTGRVPDENFAREVMQLFTIGLYELNADGSERRDAAGQRIETYDLDDVTGLARVFTGYEMDYRDNRPTPVPTTITTFGELTDTQVCRKPMILIAANHSTLETSFLRTTIAAGTDGKAALAIALDTLFSHPNVGPFFVRQMIQRLVTSNPTRAYVKRAAAVFDNNGQGVRGDLQAVFTAILLDEEARDSTLAARNGYGKVREPVVRLVQWAHTFGDYSSRRPWYIWNLSDATQLGQSPLRAPSVFNFFRPGYVPPGTQMAKQDATAPEFQIINETTTASYINFMVGIVRYGIWVRLSERAYDVAGNYSEPPGESVPAPYAVELPLASTPVALVAHLNLQLAAGRLSAETVQLIANAVAAVKWVKGDEYMTRNRISVAVILIMASPEYLIQK